METQYTRISMTPSGVPPVFYMSQYDVGRPIGFICDADLSNYTVTLEATRTDGTPVYAAVTTDGNIGAFVTTATMTNKEDNYPAQIVISADGKRIASIHIRMHVVKAAMDENAEGVEEDASLFQQYTGTVQSLIAEIRSEYADLDDKVEQLEAEYWYVTPEMYGAAGDGVTDDTEALRDCFVQGGNIIIPEGKTYAFSDYIPVISGSNIQLDGTLNVIQSNGENGDTSLELFSRTVGVHGYDGVHDVVIHGSGRIEMRGDEYTDAYATPLRIHHCSNITVQGITIRNYSKYHAIEVGGSTNVLIENVKILGCFANGATGIHEAIQIESISESGTERAIYYDGTMSKNVTIRGCYFGPSDEGGVLYGAVGSHDAAVMDGYYENIVIEECDFNQSAHFTIRFAYNVKGLTIRRNTFRDAIGDTSIIIQHYMRDVLIEDNRFYNLPVSAIWLGANDSTVDTDDTVERAVIRGNYIYNYNSSQTTTADGIGIRCVNDNCAVVNNVLVFDDTYANYPIRITGTYTPYTTNFVAQGNSLNGNYTSSANTLEHTITAATLTAFLNSRIDAVLAIPYTKGVSGLSNKNVVTVYGSRIGYYEAYSVAYLNKTNSRVIMVTYFQPTNLRKIVVSQYASGTYSHYETAVTALSE